MSVGSVGSPDGGVPDAAVNQEPEPPPTSSEPGLLDQAGQWLSDTFEEAKDWAGDRLNDAGNFVEKHWDTILDGADCADAVIDKEVRKGLEECKEFGESLGEDIYNSTHPPGC